MLVCCVIAASTSTTVVLLGRAGAGKTTLLGLLLQDKLIARGYDPDDGPTVVTVRVCGCSREDEEEIAVEYPPSLPIRGQIVTLFMECLNGALFTI